MNKVYGYVRVSSARQKTDRQVLALSEFGVSADNIFTDKQSGKDFNRSEYQRMLTVLQAHDTLVVMSIDRLGRNYGEINEQWRALTKERGVFMVVLDMSLLDTRVRKDDVTATFIADLVLQLLSYFAHKEREVILQRQLEGISAAKLKGVKFGRKPLAVPEGFDEVRLLYESGKISRREAGRRLGVTRHTFEKWLGDSK